MWIIALIIYLIGVPVAFVIGCMPPSLGRRKKNNAGLNVHNPIKREHYNS